MSAIWQNDGSGWHLLAPAGFPNEATLHTLVEQAPHLLPLAGTPRLIVVGREVQLGNGYGDLILIEPIGRMAVFEIKLARNINACIIDSSAILVKLVGCYLLLFL